MGKRRKLYCAFVDPQSTTQATTQATTQVIDLVQPLLETPAFRRLNGISFLGILSPRYAPVMPPVMRRYHNHLSPNSLAPNDAPAISDGSRADHSIGVANIAVEICHNLGFSIPQQKYAAAWGLLHDVGNWPLSHTAQQAFSERLGTKPKIIREWLTVNDPRGLQNNMEKYFVAEALHQCGIDPHKLLSLFKKTPDDELKPVFELLQSPVTPDMIEGMWRAGRAFGIHNYAPHSLNKAFYANAAQDIFVNNDARDDVLTFWRTKQEIYARFFAAKEIVTFESQWSQAIARHFEKNHLTQQAALELDEAALVADVAKDIETHINNHINTAPCKPHRWKPPVRQRINTPLPQTLALKTLDKTLVEESIED